MPRFKSTTLTLLLCFAAHFSEAQTAGAGQQDQQLRFAILVSLVPVVVAFSFIVFVFYRAKRESLFKQKEAELKLSLSELELKALRAQINPHFIFNCLNSIHHYIHQHNARQAGEYLVKFSQLIRYVLETSSVRLVPLTDDLDALRAYIELERLRLQSSFTTSIDTSAVPNTDAVHIPAMMIQPFVENSIWHGLNSMGNGGHVHIALSKKTDMLQCLIEDNGNRNQVSASATVSNGVKKTSMGMTLIRERLAAVSSIYNVDARFTMYDRMNDTPPATGTRIVLLLPFED
jgi:LytS/YehU family sensor histidine kinase